MCEKHIIKELAEEFEKQFNCSGKNNEKYITFSVPIEKEVTRINKNGEEIEKVYILQFIGSGRFMASSLSNLVNNLSEGIHKNKVNTEIIIKNVKSTEFNISIATVFLNTQALKII